MNDRSFHHCGSESGISADKCDKEIVEMHWSSLSEIIFCLTHLGFGLNVAPKDMVAVLKTVLENMDRTENAVDSYIDDILVEETAVPVQRVVEHLGKFGLIAKPPESLEGRTALGL